MEAIYKEALMELTGAIEQLETLVEKAKEIKKTVTKEDYVQILEEENRILKERIENVATKRMPDLIHVSETPMSWNSWIMMFVCFWIFLMFLGL